MPEGGRVIAGSAKGVRLETAGTGTRPLSERVKESLFGTLEADGALYGPFLDLFAGTGAAGIEALSRGAPAATFVEDSSRACALIRANLKRASLANGTVICRDVGRHLRSAPSSRFGAAFIDPPYDRPEHVVAALDALAGAESAWLDPAAVVIAKHFWKDELPEVIGSLVLSRQKRFGETMLSFYTRHE